MKGLLDLLRASRFGRLAWQFGKFGMVGVVGLAVDTTAVYILLGTTGLPFFAARVPAFLAAATTTFALNRAFTFRGAAAEPLRRQWLRFIAANAFGGAVNYATSIGLTAAFAVVASHPVLAIAAGSVAGMAFNFLASKHLIFKGA